MTAPRASWNTTTEPTQLSLPVEGREAVVDRLEKQFDQLLDLLAADQSIGVLDVRRRQMPTPEGVDQA
jgi:hypothetical protein